MLAAANFLAVLNMTIANVAVPNIAGSLGAATSQGTWVITAYAVGEAITVPLTGWLSARFSSVRVFFTSMVLFGLFLGCLRAIDLDRHAGRCPNFAGTLRRPVNAAVADVNDAHLPQGQSGDSDRLMVDDYAGCPSRWPHFGRLSVR